MIIIPALVSDRLSKDEDLQASNIETTKYTINWSYEAVWNIHAAASNDRTRQSVATATSEG
jgi:hypothetical protein